MSRRTKIGSCSRPKEEADSLVAPTGAPPAFKKTGSSARFSLTTSRARSFHPLDEGEHEGVELS